MNKEREVVPDDGSDERLKLYTIPRAAAKLNIKSHALRRAVKLGLVPSYLCFNSRVLVLLSEVRAAMAAYAQGGAKQ